MWKPREKMKKNSNQQGGEPTVHERVERDRERAERGLGAPSPGPLHKAPDYICLQAWQSNNSC